MKILYTPLTGKTKGDLLKHKKLVLEAIAGIEQDIKNMRDHIEHLKKFIKSCDEMIEKTSRGPGRPSHLEA